MLERLLGKDPDIVFAYQTERILKVKDWTLAIIGNLFTLLVLAYSIIYVFLILQKYNIKGIWTGYSFFNVEGKGYSKINETYTVWDHGDLLYPEQDSQGLMIGIKVDEIPEQTYGYCSTECFIDSDCENNPPISYPKCNSNGYCESPSWCPSIDSNTTTFSSHIIQNIESFKLQIWSGITFPQFDTEEYISYSQQDQVFSSSDANIFYIKDILNEAGIDGIEDILETGAIIKMDFDWKCDAHKTSCSPDVKFSRCDSESLPTYYT
jgi:hypothetical protein